MSVRDGSSAQPAEQKRASAGRAARWFVLAMALAALAGCEHGQLSFNRDTGQFSVPIGAGSREQQ